MGEATGGQNGKEKNKSLFDIAKFEGLTPAAAGQNPNAGLVSREKEVRIFGSPSDRQVRQQPTAAPTRLVKGQGDNQADTGVPVSTTPRRQTVLGPQGAQGVGRRKQRSATVLTLGLASTTKKKLLGQ